VREDAAGSLRRLQPSGAISGLLKLLDERTVSTCLLSIRELGLLGAKEAVGRMAGLLSSSDASIRASVSQALGAIGAKEAVRELILRLGDRESEVRWCAGEALRRLYVHQLLSGIPLLLEHQDPKTRNGAAWVAGEF
jgi:HEAT repeat protein